MSFSVDMYLSSAFLVLLSTQRFRLQARITTTIIFYAIKAPSTSIANLELFQWTYQACLFRCERKQEHPRQEV